MKIIFRWLIQCYRLLISPLLGPRCRFYPTCSTYALEALEQHPLGYASWLIAKRLGRCHPWGGFGYDPVPPAKSKNSNAVDSKHQKTLQFEHLKALSRQHRDCVCHSLSQCNKTVLAETLHTKTMQKSGSVNVIQDNAMNRFPLNPHASTGNRSFRHRNRKFTPYTSQPKTQHVVLLRGSDGLT